MNDLGEARPFVLGAMAVYLLAMLAIGAWAARRTRNERDFFIAGQGRGLVVTALATMASAFSGFVFIGGPGLMYRIGLGSLWIVAPIGFTAALLCWVPARKLWRLAARRGVCTLPEAMLVRFESPLLAGLTAVAIAFGAVAYLGVQLLALGVLLQALFGFDSLAAAIAVGISVLASYGIAGGMLAGIWTELVQGTLMLAAAIAVFVRALDVTGGWSALTSAIRASVEFGPSFLDPLGELPPEAAFGFFFLFGVGVLGQPHLLHKFLMLDDERKLRWMPLVLGGSQILCLLVWVGIGLAVPALVSTGLEAPLGRADDAASTFVLGHCPSWLAALALAGTVAAIMSTSDAFLNLASAALVRDLPRALGRRSRRELTLARAAVAGVAIAAALLAWAWGDLVALIGAFAFGTFAAALAPTMALGLAWDEVPARAALASTATGLALAPGLELLRSLDPLPWVADPLAAGVPPGAVALAASFLVLIAVTVRTKAPHRA